MVEDEQSLLTLAILVFGTLLLLVAAVVALVRSRRIPGLGATSGRAIEQVAAELRASRSALELDLANALESPASA